MADECKICEDPLDPKEDYLNVCKGCLPAFLLSQPRNEVTVDTVLNEVKMVQDLANPGKTMGDNSSAHAVEDAIVRKVLETIAEGCSSNTAKELAHAALSVYLVDYDRWYD